MNGGAPGGEVFSLLERGVAALLSASPALGSWWRVNPSESPRQPGKPGEPLFESAGSARSTRVGPLRAPL